MTLSALGIFSAAGAGGAAPVSDFVLIETVILASNQTSVTFSNLGNFSSTYRHLQLRLAARGNRSPFAQDTLRVYLNGDTTVSNYNVHFLVGTGSNVAAAADTNNYMINVDGSGSAANAFGAGVVDFLDAYSTTKNKTVRALSGHSSPDAGGATGKRVGISSMLWRNTNSITSIRIDSLDTTLIANSRFSLYGIKG